VGRIIYDTAMSLDGWIADADHSLDWLFAAAGSDAAAPEDLVPSGATVFVEGSTTYEWVLAHERLLEHPQRWFELYGSRPTFVFTTRALPVPAGADVRFVRGRVADALPEIRAAAGEGDIWVVGGGDLAGQFLDADALDEIAVSIAPVTLGGGAPVLPRRVESDRLRLVSASQSGPFARLVFTVARGG